MKRHWYCVELVYVLNRREIFSRSFEIGICCQSDILKHRLMKQRFAPAFVADPSTKKSLNNGQVVFKVKAYLGKFDGGGKNLREYLAEKFGDLMAGYFLYVNSR